VEKGAEARAIIHLDMDCFYAAIEVRDRPSLLGKPVGVGGARERRGVLTTCNYEARKFGVRSAMPTFMALQRCPNLIVLPTRFDVYRREAAVIRGILHRFTSLIEPLSLDEAYLDVTAHPGAPGPLAQVIRGTIFRKTKLTSSAGIGPNKLIAKIASEINKPNGQFEVRPEQVSEFMGKLPVRKMWGIGEKSERKLEDLFQDLMADLAQKEATRSVTKIFVKLKFNDFTRTTAERAGLTPTLQDFRSLLAEAFARTEKPVRLIGLGVRFAETAPENAQMDLL